MLIALAYFIPAVVTWWWAARYFADDFGTDAEDLVLASVLAFCVLRMWPVGLDRCGRGMGSAHRCVTRRRTRTSE